MTGARKPVPRGERDINRQPTAQGRPGCPRLNLYARVHFCLAQSAHETAGVSRHPVFPAPSRFGEGGPLAKLGRIPPRERGGVCCWPSLRGKARATFSAVVPDKRATRARSGIHTAESVEKAQWSTSFEKRSPGVMGPGFRQDDTVVRSPMLPLLCRCSCRAFSSRNGPGAPFRQRTVNGFARGFGSTRVLAC